LLSFHSTFLRCKAAQIAKGAEACANAGNPQKAVEIVMDVEQLVARRLPSHAARGIDRRLKVIAGSARFHAAP
jgi:hypothetical protein